MARPFQHQAFGTLVAADGGLLTFRRFPHMKAFWYPDADREIGLLDEPERGWVGARERHVGPLAKVRRRSDVHSALAALGVYEVEVDAAGGDAPSPAQVETYRRFLEREGETCRNACDALLRYYRKIRSSYPDWFTSSEPRAVEVAEDLGPLVSFDGIHLGREEADGLCPVSLGWDPEWDREHKLVMILYGDQVLEIGPTCGGSLLLLSPEEYLTAGDLVWGPDDLNDAERSALGVFLDGYGLADRYDR